MTTVPRSQNRRQIGIVFALTTSYLVVEVVGGVLTGSLALLADAAHMLTDVGGLALAWFAIRFAERSATPSRTYGFYRGEILAALANAVVLLVISGYILFEAYGRFIDPPKVESVGMLGVATVGLVVNVIGIYVLRSGSSNSLNVKGAYFEVVSDMLSSLAVLAAGAIIWATNWYYADPLFSAGIGLFILPRTWTLLREAIGVLLEGTPSTINITALRDAIAAVPGVSSVHDLHVWSLTSGMNAMSAHAVLADGAQLKDVLPAVQTRITTDFKIDHVTVQLEPPGFQETETHL
jgi:cobalt-zinc-cadmium efflux system protein